ncbi:putative ubiquinone biosynthesis monooxygenase [Coemansia sp. RSA 1085]|nr:putative ubiquinone biosynthesis monooxygenase [Coemansia sp. RSA 1085]
MAAALGSLDAMSHMRIALVDSGKLSDIRQWEPPTDTYLPRTLQITASNQRFLERLGVWNLCFEDRIQAYNRAVVTDALGKGKVDLVALNSSSSDAAFMIETKNLVSGLLKAIDHNGSRIDVFERSKVSNWESAPKSDASPAATNWPTITLSNNRQLQARLVIGADGANSCVRKHANIGTYGTKYAQYGLVATLCLQEPISAAFQRFLPTGPIAMLPFPGGFANLVWSLDADLIQLLKSGLSSDIVNAAFRLSPVEMERIYDMLRSNASTEQINNEIAWRLQHIHSNDALPPVVAAIASKSSFPLQLRMVDSLIADRVALVGDAGHVMHPLAGQGLNMGLEDVQCLAQVLNEAAMAEASDAIQDLMRDAANLFDQASKINSQILQIDTFAQPETVKTLLKNLEQSRKQYKETLERARSCTAKLVNEEKHDSTDDLDALQKERDELRRQAVAKSNELGLLLDSMRQVQLASAQLIQM